MGSQAIKIWRLFHLLILKSLLGQRKYGNAELNLAQMLIVYFASL